MAVKHLAKKSQAGMKGDNERNLGEGEDLD